jgi:hypothetical protein
MACPQNIKGSASQLFYRNKDSAEYNALLVASLLPHPQRPILSMFILNADNPDVASEFFLDEISNQDAANVAEFLADWISLVEKCKCCSQLLSSVKLG